MNVLIHRSLDENKKKARKGKGQIIAGAAYSIPWTDGKLAAEQGEAVKKKVDGTNVRVSWDPWKAGEGAKVQRGEPLTFKFHVGWFQESDISSLALLQAQRTSVYAIVYNVLMFLVAGCVGGALAMWWDHFKRKRGSAWNGGGLLGHAGSGNGGFFDRKTRGVSINLGSGNKPSNGYGGYGFNGKNGASQGYGGYTTGKRD